MPGTIEEHAVGHEKVSVTIVLKTRGDLVVATNATERWYASPDEARNAVEKMLRAIIEVDGEGE